jgi:acetylglutamate kinase
MSTGHTAPLRPKQVIASTMAKARIFQEAMPFIKAYRGKIVVIKYGGSAMVDESLRETFADDVDMLHLVGIKPIIVHGGGPQISRAMGQAGKEPVWVDGLRVTDAETLRVVQATLAGDINPDIVRLINGHGAVAAGTTGLDANLFHVQPVDERLGYVGEITAVNPGLLHRLLDDGFVPVIAPLGRGDDGMSYNINADTAAGALAGAIGAAKLVYLTDVEGLYRDLGDSDSLISRIDVTGLEELLAGGSISAGMLPKLQSVVDAMKAGVQRSHILDGRVQHALLLEIFTPEGIGTMVFHEGDA